MGSSSLPGHLPKSGIEPRSSALQADSLPTEPQGKPKNTGVGSLALLQQNFPTQESNQGLLHCRWILYQLNYQGSLIYLGELLFTPGFPGGRMIKNLPAVEETWIPVLGGEDPLEKGMAIHSSILAWKISWTAACQAPLSMEFSRQQF